MVINLGYCCISTIHEELRCNKSTTKTYLEKMELSKRRQYLLEKAKSNLSDLTELISRNKEAKIMAFRMPEQILPQLDLGYYNPMDLREELKLAGRMANTHQVMLSTHPSQYFVLNSLREDVVEKTIHSLNLFAETMDLMELLFTPTMVLHVGVKKGYKTTKDALDAFCKNYERLNKEAKSYLVVENDHVSFTPDDCFYIHEKIGIPVVFDHSHFLWNPGELSYEECVKRAAESFSERIPKFHLSSERDQNKHAHSEYVLLEDYKRLTEAIKSAGVKECIIMFECKGKDLAVKKIIDKISKEC